VLRCAPELLSRCSKITAERTFHDLCEPVSVAAITILIWRFSEDCWLLRGGAGQRYRAVANADDPCPDQSSAPIADAQWEDTLATGSGNDKT